MLEWPLRPLCHDKEDTRRFEKTWRPPTVDARGRAATNPFYTCSYCGSISPLDLYLHMLNTPALRFDQADLKYGWPHKVYVEGIPHPLQGQPMVIGHEAFGSPNQRELWGAAPLFAHAKFYTKHLFDLVEPTTTAFLEAFNKIHPCFEFFIEADPGAERQILWRRKVL